MPNPDLIPEPFAQSGDKNPIPLERAISDPIYRASWKAGFPPDTRIPKDIGGEPPDGLDFNGVLNILSQAVVFLQKGNAYQFDASLAPYPIGALVRSNDDLTTFQSTIALNSNNPNSNMIGWRVYNGSGFIVDNLTTNDSAKALSAAQGKVLNDTLLSFVGSVSAFAMNAAPTGWLACSGQAVSRTTYADLFAKIGTIYGAGNGSTTFTLPDLRGEFVRGFDNGRGIDTGREFGSAQEGMFKSHNHTLRMGGDGNSVVYTNTNNAVTTANQSASGASAGSVQIDNTGGVETRPRNIALLYCIKY